MVKKKKGQTRVLTYPDWCKGCGLCAAFCPAKVFEIDATGKCHVVREEECINCGFCELHCPDFAIKVMPKSGKDELPGVPGVQGQQKTTEPKND